MRGFSGFQEGAKAGWGEQIFGTPINQYMLHSEDRYGNTSPRDILPPLETDAKKSILDNLIPTSDRGLKRKPSRLPKTSTPRRPSTNCCNRNQESHNATPGETPGSFPVIGKTRSGKSTTILVKNPRPHEECAKNSSWVSRASEPIQKDRPWTRDSLPPSNNLQTPYTGRQTMSSPDVAGIGRARLGEGVSGGMGRWVRARAGVVFAGRG
jgi:hypothetical protein